MSVITKTMSSTNKTIPAFAAPDIPLWCEGSNGVVVMLAEGVVAFEVITGDDVVTVVTTVLFVVLTE